MEFAAVGTNIENDDESTSNSTKILVARHVIRDDVIRIFSKAESEK